MKELAVPDKTKCMASKAAVDLHDHLKRDMMTLFSLEKILQKKVLLIDPPHLTTESIVSLTPYNDDCWHHTTMTLDTIQR